MFNNKLIKRVKQLEDDLWKLKYPKGEVFDADYYNSLCLPVIKFKYWYKDKIYIADLDFHIGITFHAQDVDYAKTNYGYVFTTPHRQCWKLVQFGAIKAIEIPEPYLHDKLRG